MLLPEVSDPLSREGRGVCQQRSGDLHGAPTELLRPAPPRILPEVSEAGL